MGTSTLKMSLRKNLRLVYSVALIGRFFGFSGCFKNWSAKINIFAGYHLTKHSTGPKVRGHFCLNQVGVISSGMWAG